MTEQSTQSLSYWKLFKLAVSGKHEQDFTRGSIGIAAFLLSVPMVLEMAMESVFAITDIFFVSGLGAQAVAVVGLTEAVLTLLYALAIGLSMGVTATISRRIGEKKPEQANEVAGQTLLLGLVLSVLVGSVGVYFAEDILRLMGAEAEALEIGTHYTSVMLGGSITILYLFLINAIFRGAGDATIAMRSLWLANGINIVLDPLLIYGVGPFPEMGVTGAAVATTIGRSVGVAYQLYHLRSHFSRIRVNWSHITPDWLVLKNLVKVSTGGVLQFLIATASWVALVRIVSTYSSAAVAGYTIAIRVVIFTILPAWGMSNAVATLVGQNLGAGKPDRAERSVLTIARYNVGFMLVVALVFLLFAEGIIRLFTQEPEIVANGISCLTYMAYGYVFYGIGMILVQAFNGAGDTMTPTYINLFCFWMLQIPLAYTLAKYAGYGPDGVYMAVALSESVLAVVGIWAFRKGRWKLKQV